MVNHLLAFIKDSDESTDNNKGQGILGYPWASPLKRKYTTCHSTLLMIHHPMYLYSLKIFINKTLTMDWSIL